MKFDELYETHKQYVFNVCFKYLRDTHLAEDMVHEVFKKILENPKLRDEKYLATWLYAIARNASIDYMRSKQGRRMQELPENFEISHIPRFEKHKALRSAVDALPPLHRIVVIMRYWWGLSYRELSRSLGISVPAVGQRLHNAVKSLRWKLSA